MIKRREFIAGLGAGVALPLAARAQQPDRMRRVGVLMKAPATDTEFQSYLAAFSQGLRQLGWTEGQNLRIDVRWNSSDAVLARTYAAQLIGLMPDVILATSTVNLTAIQQVTSIAPVVFVEILDPVAQGFVASMRQPGGNLTGFSLLEISLGGKWLDLLKNAATGLERVAIMFNPEISSLHLDVRLANDAAELVILFAKKSGETHAAQPNRKKPLDGKLRLDLGCLHCRGEPAGQLGDRFLRRLRRS